MKNVGKEIKAIDLFAGIGGMRMGFLQACNDNGMQGRIVFTSEIKKPAIKVFKDNYPHDVVHGNITQVSADSIPDFDVLLAGFPCQPFSDAGNRRGFQDTRGTLFFEIERILREKKPFGFILENVEGLVKHDRADKKSKVGRTLETIIGILEEIGYQTTWKLLDAQKFGLAQRRKRIFIVGTLKGHVDLDAMEQKKKVLLKDVLEKGLPTMETDFCKRLLKMHNPQELYGMAIKDRRGGDDNIHSWDLGIKGVVTKKQRELLNLLLKERRKRHWAERKKIVWMDGMPLTLNEIKTFFDVNGLKEMLSDLVEKGYLSLEHPKDLKVEVDGQGRERKSRWPREDIEKGYNIVAGKLSFPIALILDPDDVAPTLVATDVDKLAVVDGKGLRKLTLSEGISLFGFGKDFIMNVPEREGFDLLGNTLAVPVVRAITNRILDVYSGKDVKEVEPELFPLREYLLSPRVRKPELASV